MVYITTMPKSKTKSKRDTEPEVSPVVKRKRRSEAGGDVVTEETFTSDPEKVVELYTNRAFELKRIFENLSHLLSECNLVFLPPVPDRPTSEGLRISKMNADGNVLVKLSVPAANFAFYKCDADQVIAGIDIPEFHNKLKNIDDKDAVYIYMNRGNTDTLYINSCRSDNRHEGSKAIEINLIYVLEDDVIMDQVQFESRVSMPGNDFLKMCKNMSVSSDALEIRSGGKTVTFSVRNESGSVSDIRHKFKGTGMSCYAGRFKMKNVLVFAKYNRICDKISLYLLNGYPLVINIEIRHFGQLVGFLLPQIDTTDD